MTPGHPVPRGIAGVLSESACAGGAFSCTDSGGGAVLVRVESRAGSVFLVAAGMRVVVDFFFAVLRLRAGINILRRRRATSNFIEHFLEHEHARPERDFLIGKLDFIVHTLCQKI